MNTSFSLPIPPSVNSLYGQRSGRQRYKTKEYKIWEAEAALALFNKPECKYIAGDDLTVHYTFFFPNKRKRDIANFEKALSDFITSAGVIEDDSHIGVMVLTRGEIDKEKPRVEVTVHA